jgi:hypothetical protein
MTITEFADQLATDIRASDQPRGPHLRLGLQFAVDVWLQGQRAGNSAMQWDSCGSAVQLVLSELFRGPRENSVIFEPGVLDDDHTARQAIHAVLSAAADVLAAYIDGSQRWHNATAATQLRIALDDLR